MNLILIIIDFKIASCYSFLVTENHYHQEKGKYDVVC